MRDDTFRLLPPKSALKEVGLLSRPSIPMDDRKRRLGADDNASSVSSTAPRPPLKKRFTGTGPTNFSSPSSPVKAEPMQLVIDTNALDVRLLLTFHYGFCLVSMSFLMSSFYLPA
jgi:hypothetical protein